MYGQQNINKLKKASLFENIPLIFSILLVYDAFCWFNKENVHIQRKNITIYNKVDKLYTYTVVCIPCSCFLGLYLYRPSCLILVQAYTCLAHLYTCIYYSTHIINFVQRITKQAYLHHKYSYTTIISCKIWSSIRRI